MSGDHVCVTCRSFGLRQFQCRFQRAEQAPGFGAEQGEACVEFGAEIVAIAGF
jgi:hypothetical protein